MAYPYTRSLLDIRKKELSEEELDSMQEYHYFESRIESGKRIQFTQNKYYSGRKETKKIKTDYHD